MSKHGHFCWNELTTKNVEQAKSFYHDCMGWEFDTMPLDSGGTYWLAKDESGPICGMYETHGTDFDSMADQWLPYIEADDVDKRVAIAREGGAKIFRGPFEVPGVGRIAILREPGGALVGWITPVPED